MIATPQPGTTESTIAYDPWDQASESMWYAHIDPSTLEGLWRQPQDSLFINHDELGYWHGEPGVMGQNQFKTLEEAKAAGNARLEEAEKALAGNLLLDAGLDPDVWNFEYLDGARFKNRMDESLVIEIEIERENVRDRFAAYSGDDEVGEYATAGEAASALVDRPAPGI